MPLYNNPLLLESQYPNAAFRTPKLTACYYRSCPRHATQVSATRSKRKPRPSFNNQVRQKWSQKLTSTREKFPWQQPEEEDGQQLGTNEEDEREREASGLVSAESELGVSDLSASSSVPSSSIVAPWFHGTNSGSEFSDSQRQKGGKFESGLHEDGQESDLGDEIKDKAVNFDSVLLELGEDGEEDEAVDSLDEKFYGGEKGMVGGGDSTGGVSDSSAELPWEAASVNDKAVTFDSVSFELGVDGEEDKVVNCWDKEVYRCKEGMGSGGDSTGRVGGSSVMLPWEATGGVDGRDRKGNTSNTELAEGLLPEHELKRLRNVALRMLDRIKVRAAGITQALVDDIHKKWKIDEIVKLKFEEPLSKNMKRTHELLESKTGGLVIWRSGSSVVLYRGMTYKFQCVKSFTMQNEAPNAPPPCEKMIPAAKHTIAEHFVKTKESIIPDAPKYMTHLSYEEIMDFQELNHLLDELGPRFMDWCGCDPIPVDADLLPRVVPRYKTPARALAHGVRSCLKDEETTLFRKLARKIPAHFALGRNRDLEGLANAMVKLWERSAIAKIAIKRGVPNTRNKIMAEELKRLTGGTLLSRNKEFIVFYRGNDFLPPAVQETLNEREKLTFVRQDEEEQARKLPPTFMEKKIQTEGHLAAGTLAETEAATSLWGSQTSNECTEELMRDSTLSKLTSLLNHLMDKLALAKRKLKRSERALAKVEENMEPTGLPSDLETLTDEERFSFRKIGLSMKPYLVVGTRGVFGGTIENMHLHWKYRELVKIIVKRKNFEKVKEIATSLEAESGGVLVSVDKTSKGYATIIYRGKNYRRPGAARPKNLLTRRQALARSVELQRYQALERHCVEVQLRIGLVKSELEKVEAGTRIEVDKTLYSSFNDAPSSYDDFEEDEGQEPHFSGNKKTDDRT